MDIWKGWHLRVTQNTTTDNDTNTNGSTQSASAAYSRLCWLAPGEPVHALSIALFDNIHTTGEDVSW